MLITIKNLQQQTFLLRFRPEKTVLELKQKIFNERGAEYVVEKQRLIYAGIILEDNRTIASYNVDEKKFIVVMLKRDLGCPPKKEDEESASSTSSAEDIADSKKETAGSSDAASTKLASSSTARSSGETSVIASTGVTVDSATTGTAAPASETSQGPTFSTSSTSLQSRAAESNLLMGEEYNRSVESIVEMGYRRDMVERAMAASFNNPERAVEYLISGIPEARENDFNASSATAAVAGELAAQVAAARAGSGAAGLGLNPLMSADGATVAAAAAAAAAIAAQTRTSDGRGVSGAGGSGREDPFEFLRNQPQFLQMRSLVYQNPDLLHAVLQQIGQTNPALLQLISENQDAFLSMLNQPVRGGLGHDSTTRPSPANSRRMPPDQRANAEVEAGGDGLQVRPMDTTSASGAGVEAAERRTAAEAQARERAAIALAAGLGAAREIGGGDGAILQQSQSQQRESSSQQTVSTFRLTPQDQVAIERLKALGFSEALVLQAYFACDKDEQLTANFLISSAFDD